jgi:hypothetical protein
MCGTVRTNSETGLPSAKRIHSMPNGLVPKPDTYIPNCSRYRSPGRRDAVGSPKWWYRQPRAIAAGGS